MEPDVQKAAAFIWLNARLLDRHRFAFHFLSASRDQVLAALRPYQNADGGFGNGLEPDLRAPTSQPQPVEFALHILDEIDAYNDPSVPRACAYLTTITTSEGGVPFVLESASAYPSAPWWITADYHPPASLNPTAAIAGLLHKHNIATPWLAPATDYCWRVLEANTPLGGYDYKSVLTFLEYVPDHARAEGVFQRLAAGLLESDQLTLDPDAEGHVFMPLDFAPLPSSPMRRYFPDDVIERHLGALIRRQQPDGGWPITWTPPSTLAEMEWRASVTLGALLLLRASNVLPAVAGKVYSA
jgi:hypothetical protein